MDTHIYLDDFELAERNERAHAYSVKGCRRRACAKKRRNGRRERILRGAVSAVVLTAVLCGVLIGGAV